MKNTLVQHKLMSSRSTGPTLGTVDMANLINIVGTVSAILAFMLSLLIPAVSQAQESSMTNTTGNTSSKMFLTTGYEYSRGKYGTDSDISIALVPISFKYDLPGWAFRASVAYVRARSDTPVLLSDSAVVIDGPSTNATNASQTITGFIDPVLGVTYKVPAAKNQSWLLDLTAKVKLPVASRSQRLSSGKTDYVLEAEVTHDWRPVSAFWGGGYKWRGQDEDQSQRNSAFIFAGSKWHLANGDKLTASFDYAERASVFSSHEAELGLSYTRKLSNQHRLTLYGNKGLTDGSANYALGISYEYQF